jgi:sterol desaturase/sphingolipid hydroxylase (fatty acid hydroxylase superfamily)
MNDLDLTIYAIPAFFVLMVVEAALLARTAHRGYEWRDTAASLTMGVGSVVIGLATKAVHFALLAVVGRWALFTIEPSWTSWLVLLVLGDLAYYWFHRLSHDVRILWAAHVNHHSSERYNLSTALRQSWTTPFTVMLFYWPLALLGFPPAMILAGIAVNTLYQFWIHTELIDRVGRLEAVLNTASHHRVHHGTNVQYLDRNHGGILILWDKLFGTFTPEGEPVRYGLTRNIRTFNPVHIAFHEWEALWRDVRRATTWRERLGYALAPPGWSADGSTLTSRQLQRRLAAEVDAGRRMDAASSV